MGNFYTETIQNEAKEIDFLTAVYNRIMGTQENPSIFWSGITCSVTPEDGETIENATPSDMVYEADKICNMDFLLDSTNNIVLRLQIKPSYYWYMRNACYNFILLVNGEKIVDKKDGSGTRRYDGDGIRYADGGSDGQVTTFDAHRELTFSKFTNNDGTFIFWVTPKTSTSFKNASISFMKFKDTSNNVCWAGNEATSPIENGKIINLNDPRLTTKSSMFPFEARTGYLDFISHSSFVSGSTKAFTSTDIYDCTTVNMGDTLSLKDGANFLAIGAHSMVRLDDEEG